jgi:elongation factor G
VPASLAEQAGAARDALIEMVAEADDTLMEKFFESGTLSQEELVSGLRTATLAGRIFPLVCASGLLNIGVQPLLDAVVGYLPSPLERPVTANNAKTGEEVSVTPDPAAPYAAFVWKTVADPFAGRITLFRVVTGTLKSDANAHNLTRDTSERLGHLTMMQGKTPTSVPEIRAGDLGAVAKLKDTLTNDTLAEKNGLSFAPIAFPEPVLSYAIEPKSRGDEDKISTAMHRWRKKIRRSSTRAIRRPTSCCCPGRDSCTSRSRSPN